MQHVVRPRKMLLAAVALASGVTLECDEAAGIGLFDSGLGCQAQAGFSSYCEIVDVTTTCGVKPSCNESTNLTSCTFPTPAADCDITVTLVDGTQHVLPVTVASHGPDCGAAGIYGVALPLMCEDAGAPDASANDADADANKVDAPAD